MFVKITAFVLIVAGSLGCGLWLAKRLGRPQGQELSLRQMREGFARNRAQLRAELTPGERRFFYAYGLVSPLLAPAGIGLVVWGDSSTRGAGIALLIVALLVTAVPVSPFLRARVRRREKGGAN